MHITSGPNYSAHLVWVDNFLSKKSVFAGIAVQQTPVHLDIPRQSVARPDDLGQYPQVEERTVLCVVIAVTCYMSTTHNAHVPAQCK